MPSSRRTAFQSLLTRLVALHDDLAVQSRVAKAAPAPQATFRLVKDVRVEAVRLLKGTKIGPLPRLPHAQTATLADLLTMLGQLRAILASHGQATGQDQQKTPAEARFEDMRKVCLRLAEVVMLDVEIGVQVRMEAIEKGEDPEEAYTIAHTFFYQAMLNEASKLGVEIPETVPRLATHADRYPPAFSD